MIEHGRVEILVDHFDCIVNGHVAMLRRLAVQNVDSDAAMLFIGRKHQNGVHAASRGNVAEHLADRHIFIGEQQVNAETHAFEAALNGLGILTEM